MWQWMLVLGVALLIWRLSRPAGDCVFRIRQGRVSTRGKIAAGKRAQVEGFLAEEFSEVRRLRIDVSYRRGSRPLKIRIRGSITPGEHQMIRNFLVNLL
jgi:hypothetical protein